MEIHHVRNDQKRIDAATQKKTRRKEKERKKEQKQTLVFRLSSIQVDLDHNIMHSKTNG